MSVIALAGNPNSGKTTLFNRLTGSRYKVGNRAGVTVEVKKGFCKENTIVDLPGIYSLSRSDAEECAAKEYLESGEAEIIINIIDATNLERSLKLTEQLAALKIPMIIALNMTDMLKKSGFSIDKEKMTGIIGAPVVMISASKGTGLEELFEKDAKAAAVDSEKIKRIMSEAVTKIGVNKPLERSIQADKILLGSVFSGIIFAGIAALVFWLTFGAPGRLLGELCEKIFLSFTAATENLLEKNNVNYFLSSLVCDGILASVGGVVPFFGQILILFFCISVLEDMGYMSRIIFLADGIFEKLKIDAKAAVPLVIGFGCSVPAAMSAKNINNSVMRKKTAELLPFIPCSAKMPVFLVFASAFFGENRQAVTIGLYVVGIASACIYACFARSRIKKEAFVLELPPYRMPTVRNTFNQLRDKLSDFVKRAGSVLFLAGIAVWFMQTFDFSLKIAALPEKSILGEVGSKIAFIFVPCGFGTWQAAVALLSGFMAKEAVLSTLAVVYGGDFIGAFSPSSAAAFLVFVLFYPPCAAALSAISTYLSKKETLCLIVRQTLIAWSAAVLVYFFLK